MYEVHHPKGDKLSNLFSNELLTPSIDLSIDYSEIFLDDLIDNDAIKEIPIVKTVIGVIKTGILVNQLWFAKKLLTFIREFNQGVIDPEKLSKFKEMFNNNEKYRKHVVENIMIFNDRFMEINKSKISAQLFKSYIEGKIDFKEFVSLNISLDKLHPDSYFFLKELENNDYKIDEELKGEKKFDEQALLLSTGLGRETSSWSHGFIVTENGKKLYELGIKNILK